MFLRRFPRFPRRIWARDYADDGIKGSVRRGSIGKFRSETRGCLRVDRGDGLRQQNLSRVRGAPRLEPPGRPSNGADRAAPLQLDRALVCAGRAPAVPPAREAVVSNEGAAVVRRHAADAATGEPARDPFRRDGAGSLPQSLVERILFAANAPMSAKPADRVALVSAGSKLRKCGT